MDARRQVIGSLPDPSILKKLNEALPGAAKTIMARFEEIGRERREAEMARFQRLVEWKSVVSRMFRAACGMKVERAEFSGMNAWYSVGNSLREAMREFCAAHPDAMAKAGLSEEERRDMAMVFVPKQAEAVRITSEGGQKVNQNNPLFG